MNHFAVQPNTFAAGGDLRSSVSVVERDQPPSFAQNHVVLGSVTTIIIILLDLSAATSGLGGSFKTTQPNHSPQGPSGLKNSRLNSALLSVTKVTEGLRTTRRQVLSKNGSTQAGGHRDIEFKRIC